MKISRRGGLLLILLLAFALRLYRLGVASLWYDETVSTFLAQQDLVELTRHTAGDIHPPLYYYFLHFWTQAAGASEFSFAFFSLFCGVVLIALAYRVARDWFNARVALITAMLVAISPYNLWYSQEVRMYTLGAALGLASVYFFVRLLRPLTTDRRPRVRDFIFYAIISALGIYTLYYFAFLLIFENLAALIWILGDSQFSIRNFKLSIANCEFLTWLFSQLAILVLYLPWIAIAFRQATDPPVPPWRSFTALPQVLLESFSALTFGQSIDPMLALPILVSVAIALAFAFRRGGERLITDHQPLTTALFLFGYTFVPLTIIYLLSLWKPLYHVRYVFVYSPAFYILLALGLERIRNLRFAFYVLLLAFYFGLCTFSIYNFWFDSKYTKDDLRGAVNYLAERWRPGDAILINAGYTYTAFDYYFKEPIAWRGRLADYPPPGVSLGTYQRLVDLKSGAIVLQTGSIGGAPNLGWGDPRSDFYATNAFETRAALDQVFATHPRVWMLRLYDTVVDPDGIIRDYLATRGRILDDQGFAGESFARVQGYLTSTTPPNSAPANLMRRDVMLGNRIVLLGFEPTMLTARVGKAIDVNVYWQAKEPTNVDSHLFIGLYADDGTLVASNDELLIGNALGTSRWTPGEILREPVRLAIPAHLTSGIYNLRVTLYNPLTNEPLTAPASKWVTNESQVFLSQITIER